MCNRIDAPYLALPTTVGYEGHDLRFRRNPMFSIGTRRSTKSSRVSTKMPLGQDRSNITRFGKQEAPQFSILGRLKSEFDGDSSPGPIYLINDRLTKQCPPVYSIIGRTKEGTSVASPGPKYAFSGDAGKRSAPAFSMSFRTNLEQKSRMPSPAEYKAPKLDACRQSAPKFSMSFRQKEIGDNFSGPGPNRYLPKIRSSAKSFSFGTRHHPCSGRITVPEDDY